MPKRNKKMPQCETASSIMIRRDRAIHNLLKRHGIKDMSPGLDAASLNRMGDAIKKEVDKEIIDILKKWHDEQYKNIPIPLGNPFTKE